MTDFCSSTLTQVQEPILTPESKYWRGSTDHWQTYQIQVGSTNFSQYLAGYCEEAFLRNIVAELLMPIIV